MALSIDAFNANRQHGTLLITRSRLRLFAKAIGLDDPVFVDVDAARAAGHPDLPVPPTFAFGVGLETPDPFAYLTEAGVDLRALLHGGQEFQYHRTAHAGDTLVSKPRVVDLFERRGGALTFIITETPVVDQKDRPIVTMTETLIVRQLVVAST